MKNLYCILLLFLTYISYANDGVYLTHGGVIYPTKETKIALEKEILSFKVSPEGVASVTIQFTFNNPENISRKLLIGFQAPTSVGDVSNEMKNRNQISNFIILQNEKILPYEIKKAECENCELKNVNEIDFVETEVGVFVYLFEITFKPGMNEIQHSYEFPYSSNVAINEFYNYILTTGSKWAGGKIKDLTITIDMGKNSYFYVNDIFDKNTEWSIIGTGKVTQDKFDYIDNDFCKMIRILNGYLQIKCYQFEPKKNIEFGIVNKLSFITYPIHHEKIKEGKIVSLGKMQLDGNYSKNELRLMRNTIYAQYGYVFNAPDLKEYFSQFGWYIPNPNLKMEDIQLEQFEKDFIEKIISKENQ
ncbi:YARHG domain-containing protein [Flavobacterium sp. NRK F7]|uniref:YARHG domain-containing protein n=1 Tax=Flavobacterium sp. NRK F7 TaxID=2954930 RepID=UPI002091D1E4|nr:YARHG domain-containing protein [Flavobacterium sp. NRK F7]MCO6163815.1 YARHG domain-containing protein [Flavobacterium sp. NRK F7]